MTDRESLERAFLTRWLQICPKEEIPNREYQFCERRWRFDFAFPNEHVGIECEGGIWTNGRHNRAKGYLADLEKYNLAAILGWCVLRFSKDMIFSGEAARQTLEALRLRR